MSRVTKLKHVRREQDADDFSLPTENQQIVKIVASKGNNLHEVESSNECEERFLVSMPGKYRKSQWIKRGDFVLVEPIEEGDKVKGEIIRILTIEHQKEYKKHKVWPKKFANQRELEIVNDNKAEDLSDDEDDIPQNPNRRPNLTRNDTSSEDEED